MSNQELEQRVDERIAQFESSADSLTGRLASVNRMIESHGQTILPEYLRKVPSDKVARELVKVARLRTTALEKLETIVKPDLERRIGGISQISEAIKVYQSSGVIRPEEMLIALDSYESPLAVQTESEPTESEPVEPILLDANTPRKTSILPERPGKPLELTPAVKSGDEEMVPEVDLFEDFPLERFEGLDGEFAVITLEATRNGAIIPKQVAFDVCKALGHFPDLEHFDQAAGIAVLTVASRVGETLEDLGSDIALKYETVDGEPETAENPKGYRYVRSQSKVELVPTGKFTLDILTRRDEEEKKS